MPERTVLETPPVPHQRSAGAEAGPRFRPTAERSTATGKAVRREVPLEALAELPRDLPDPIDLLTRDDANRVPELLPIRYGRMLASPFAFLRGSATVMAADLAAAGSTPLRAQLCGDAHLANFGVYATPERRLVFDVNDFDETLPGPFEWDVKRLVASIEVAGRTIGHRGKDRRAAVRAVAGRYRAAMRQFARQDMLSVWYANVDVDRVLVDLAPRLDSEDRRRSQRAIERARGRGNEDAFTKLATVSADGAQFRSDPPLVVRLTDLLPDLEAGEFYEALRGLLHDYRTTLNEDRRYLLDQFELVDVARKVVGVGSVGTRAFVLLLLGRATGDPLVLQAKEARASSLEPHCGASHYDNAGQRVVSGQRLVQAASDLFLGWDRLVDQGGTQRDFYLRQLRDGKVSANLDAMPPRRLAVYGQLCAWTLARAHARSGDRHAIAAYLGKRATFEAALTEFAAAYADRTERCHALLAAAADDGRVPAEPTV